MMSQNGNLALPPHSAVQSQVLLLLRCYWPEGDDQVRVPSPQGSVKDSNIAEQDQKEEEELPVKRIHNTEFWIRLRWAEMTL